MQAATENFEYKTPQQRASETLAAVMDELTAEKIKAFHKECSELVAAASTAERTALVALHHLVGNKNFEGAQSFYDMSRTHLNIVRESLKKLGEVCRNGK